MAGRGPRLWRAPWSAGSTAATAAYQPLYPLNMPLADKIRTIAREIYRAADIALPDAVAKRLASFEAAGFGDVPVCIAKTQYSFTADPTVLGAPDGHVLPVRDVRLSAGAGFVVAICGDIMTMPGLPRVPAAESIFLRDGWRDRGAVLNAERRETRGPANAVPSPRRGFTRASAAVLPHGSAPGGLSRPRIPRDNTPLRSRATKPRRDPAGDVTADPG